MSARVRVQGDLTRYWIVNGVPVVESLVVAYAPTDPRSEPLPDAVHATFVPKLLVLMHDEAQALTVVDGDGNLIATEAEAIVNLWLVEARSVNHLVGPLMADPIFPTDDPTPILSRKPLKGAKAVDFETYTARVAALDEARLNDIRVGYQEQVALHAAMRESVGETIAAALWGPPMTVETLMATAAKLGRPVGG